jgi:hypothetical protein
MKKALSLLLAALLVLTSVAALAEEINSPEGTGITITSESSNGATALVDDPSKDDVVEQLAAQLLGNDAWKDSFNADTLDKVAEVAGDAFIPTDLDAVMIINYSEDCEWLNATLQCSGAQFTAEDKAAVLFQCISGSDFTDIVVEAAIEVDEDGNGNLAVSLDKDQVATMAAAETIIVCVFKAE